MASLFCHKTTNTHDFFVHFIVSQHQKLAIETNIKAFLRFKYKDEYEKFKLILSGIGFVMAILNYCVRFRAFELSYIFLLVWYYCTLTIRESILKLNGSRIKGWWRFHHFFSTGAAGILLIWPDNETWLAFRNQFVLFNIYLSMFLIMDFIRGIVILISRFCAIPAIQISKGCSLQAESFRGKTQHGHNY